MEANRTGYTFEAKLKLAVSFLETKKEVEEGKRLKFPTHEDAFHYLRNVSGVKANDGCIKRIIRDAGCKPCDIIVNNQGKHLGGDGKAPFQSQLDSLRQEVEILKSQVANLQSNQ